MSSIAAAPTSAGTPTLRTLYLARFAFAIVWAGLFAATASPVGTAALVLAVIYPLVDLAAAVVDSRSTVVTGRTRTLLLVNVALSLLTAIGIAVVGRDAQGILVVWGLWAVTAGAVQLAVGITRRSLGGQWPMILSGSISILAGASFVVSSQHSSSLTSLAGYAVLGGIFFLVSALRLGHRG